MNITHLHELTFGAHDLAQSAKCLTDYGLTPVGVNPQGGRYEAEDGTGIELRSQNDPSLPPMMEGANPKCQLRITTHGVDTQATLDAIERELSRDRAVQKLADGSLLSKDDMGIVIRFKVAKPRSIQTRTEAINAPGSPVQRGPNQIAVKEDAIVKPLTLSHIVYLVPDAKKAGAFYIERLGFRLTDTLGGAGPFLRPQGTQDHHTLFFIQTPPIAKGVEHFTFHMNGPTAVLQAGYRFVAKGHNSFWGPGRHKMGSNWFWYFDCPLGCHIEYDADMDLHDDSWVAREVPVSADASQLFLFNSREKWAPAGPPKGGSGPNQIHVDVH